VLELTELTECSYLDRNTNQPSSDVGKPVAGMSLPFTPGASRSSWNPHRQTETVNEPLYDPRLSHVQASTWTSVVVDDDLFANIISTFLVWDHPSWRLFDETLFINDLVAGRTQHCSKLLVNAILAYGCQNHAAVEPHREPSKEVLGTFFLVEAKQLWHLEEGTESVTCIAASGILHGLYWCQGKDKVGFTYLAQAVRMAKDMGLLRKKTVSEVYITRQPEVRHSRAVVAWGLFTYVV